jgi:O-antigen ligase
MRMASHLCKLRLAGLCLLLIYGSLAFGAVEEWSFFLLQAGIAILFLLWSIEQVLREHIELVPNSLYFPLVGFGLWAWGLLILRPPLYRLPAVTGILGCAGFGLLFFLAVQCCRQRDAMIFSCKLLVTFGLVVSVFAIIQGFTANGKLYWVRQPQFGGWIYGPYVNHGHYAALMLMLAPLGLLLGINPRLSRDARIFSVFAAAVMGASIFTSQSRGGMVAFVLEMLLFLLCATAGRAGHRKAGLGIGAFILLVFAFGIWCTGSAVWQRFQNLEDATIRLRIAKDTVHMIAARPAAGWGLGNYQYAFPQYQTFYTDRLVDHAHNDYLEVVAETGIPGAFFVVLFIVLLYRAAIPAVQYWNSSLRSAAQLAALLACTGIFFQSLTDFNMHIPGNAAIFLFLAAVATSNHRHPPKPQDPGLKG